MRTGAQQCRSGLTSHQKPRRLQAPGSALARASWDTPRSRARAPVRRGQQQPRNAEVDAVSFSLSPRKRSNNEARRQRDGDLRLKDKWCRAQSPLHPCGERTGPPPTGASGQAKARPQVSIHGPRTPRGAVLRGAGVTFGRGGGAEAFWGRREFIPVTPNAPRTPHYVPRKNPGRLSVQKYFNRNPWPFPGAKTSVRAR